MGCQRGNLYAAMTASGNPANARDSAASTYQYTNAVLQCGPFNMGQWRIFEGRIRRYARDTCIPGRGVLFLITGISFVTIQNQRPPLPQMQVESIVQFTREIKTPNSMCTTGMCLFRTAQPQTFAVIGNNVQDRRLMFTGATSQADRAHILRIDVNRHTLKRAVSGRVELFPGVRSTINIQLPEKPSPDTDDEEEGKGKKPPSSSSSSKPSSTSPKHAGSNTRKIRLRIG